MSFGEAGGSKNWAETSLEVFEDKRVIGTRIYEDLTRVGGRFRWP